MKAEDASTGKGLAAAVAIGRKVEGLAAGLRGERGEAADGAGRDGQHHRVDAPCHPRHRFPGKQSLRNAQQYARQSTSNPLFFYWPLSYCYLQAGKRILDKGMSYGIGMLGDKTGVTLCGPGGLPRGKRSRRCQC
jgi:hypothetical protein